MEDSHAEDILRQFRRASKFESNRSKALSTSQNRKAFGYFCTYFPVEIVHAAGMLPVRILGERKRLLLVDGYLPSFGCSFVRTALESGLDGSLDYLSGVGFSHTCDSIQVLSGVWGRVVKDQFVTNIIFPAKLDEPASMDFLVKELKQFRNNLEEYLGKSIDDEELWESIHIYEKKRMLLKEIYQWRRKHLGGLKGSDLLGMVTSAMIMDPEEHNRLLEVLLSHLSEKGPSHSGTDKLAKVVLAGNMCAFPDIMDLIEESGALIVDDNLCTGSRYFSSSLEKEILQQEKDALSRIAGTYLAKISCPAKYSSQIKRDEELLSIVENSEADGVVFLLLRLCEPYSYDYTALKKSLDRRSYPSLVVEYEQQTESFEQIQTRVEAFVESIKG